MGCVQRQKQIQINSVIFQVAQPSFNKSYSANNSKAVYNLQYSFNHDVKQTNILNLNQNPIEDDNKVSTIQGDLNSKVNNNYCVIKELIEYSSTTNKMYLVKKAKTKIKMVMNVINRNFLSHDDFFIKQFSLIQNLSHNNIVKYHEYYFDNKNYFIISDYTKGESLHHALHSIEKYSEETTKSIMQNLLNGILYLHVNEIIHRDIKLENIFIKNINRPDEIMLKIINLNSAEHDNKQPDVNVNLYEKIGSPYYIAPEVLRKNYNVKCDIWSAGVIFYYLLYGLFPFMGENIDEIYAKIKIGKFIINPNVEVSPLAVDLLKKMLDYSPYTRLSAYDCLKHPWFDKDVLGEEKNGIFVLMNESVKMIIRNEYGHEDFISFEQLYDNLQNQNKGKIKNKDVEDYFNVDIKELDNGEVLSYKTFLKKVLSEEMILNQRNVIKIFNIIDEDKDGVLTTNDFKTFFTMLLYTGEKLGYLVISLESKSINKNSFSKMIRDYDKYIKTK